MRIHQFPLLVVAICTVAPALPASALAVVTPTEMRMTEGQLEDCHQYLLRKQDKLLKDIDQIKSEMKALNDKLLDTYKELDDTRYGIKNAEKQLRALSTSGLSPNA